MENSSTGSAAVLKQRAERAGNQIAALSAKLVLLTEGRLSQQDQTGQGVRLLAAQTDFAGGFQGRPIAQRLAVFVADQDAVLRINLVVDLKIAGKAGHVQAVGAGLRLDLEWTRDLTAFAHDHIFQRARFVGEDPTGHFGACWAYIDVWALDGELGFGDFQRIGWWGDDVAGEGRCSDGCGCDEADGDDERNAAN